MKKPELHLKVFADRSELVQPDAKRKIFSEGTSSKGALARYKKITKALADGYLNNQILLCKNNKAAPGLKDLSKEHTDLIDRLVNSMTSEVGRAIIGLTILQLSVKAIEPEQSIRLHKGGTSQASFSWQEGISMRTLDSNYITPILREHDILKLNKYGFMMTRSLAENYPYSIVYKANIKGARLEWAKIVELVEAQKANPEKLLQYLLSKLLNKAIILKTLGNEILKTLLKLSKEGSLNSKKIIFDLIIRHIEQSDYAARIMEISMHSLMQAMQENGALGETILKPLSQMRSANKKHGNIADIEILEDGSIVEAWDAKYGKSYLRDELEEINDKISDHPNIARVGFVVSTEPERLDELNTRRKEIEDTHGISLSIITLREWVDLQFDQASKSEIEEEELAVKWITAYVESLAQRRIQIAPIDEPCYEWLNNLYNILQSME